MHGSDDLIQLTENQKDAIASIVRWYRASNRPPVYASPDTLAPARPRC